MPIVNLSEAVQDASYRSERMPKNNQRLSVERWIFWNAKWQHNITIITHKFCGISGKSTPPLMIGVVSRSKRSIYLISVSLPQGSGSNTPPCSMVPVQVHSAFQRQGLFLSYLTSCHDLWEMADGLITKGNHTGKSHKIFIISFHQLIRLNLWQQISSLSWTMNSDRWRCIVRWAKLSNTCKVVCRNWGKCNLFARRHVDNRMNDQRWWPQWPYSVHLEQECHVDKWIIT